VLLSCLRRGDVLPQELKLGALELISSSYRNYSPTYTDDSKMDTGVGCAFVSGTVSRSFALPANVSGYTSELVAMNKALSFIEIDDRLQHVLVSDLLSSLLAPGVFYSSNSILQDILSRLTSLTIRGKTHILLDSEPRGHLWQ